MSEDEYWLVHTTDPEIRFTVRRPGVVTGAWVGKRFSVPSEFTREMFDILHTTEIPEEPPR